MDTVLVSDALQLNESIWTLALIKYFSAADICIKLHSSVIFSVSNSLTSYPVLVSGISVSLNVFKLQLNVIQNYYCYHIWKSDTSCTGASLTHLMYLYTLKRYFRMLGFFFKGKSFPIFKLQWRSLAVI